MDYKELTKKVNEKLLSTKWEKEMNFFVSQNMVEPIVKKLLEEKENGYKFTPPLSKIFRPFEITAFKDVKAVIIVDEPFIKYDYADGLAMSTNIMDPKEALTCYLQNTIFHSCGTAEYITELSNWAIEGVLLFNKALTARIDSANKHREIWATFFEYVVDKLNEKDNIVWALIGKECNLVEQDIHNDTHTVLCYNEIHRSLYESKYPWNGLKMLKEINEELHNKKVNAINWVETT